MAPFRRIAVSALVAVAVAPPAGAHGLGRLPGPVAFAKPNVRHTVLPSGRIVTARTRRSPCGGTTWMQIGGAGACLVRRGERFGVRRNGRVAWRSAGRYQLGGVFAKLGPRLAFSVERYARSGPTATLFIAPLDGRERAVAHDERPLGWTHDGDLLTWRFRDGEIQVYVRAADGTLRRRVAAGLADLRWDRRTRTLSMLSRSGVLSRSDGRRVEQVADTRALGFARRPSFELLDGGLIGLLAGSRVVVLRRDGAPVASAVVPSRGRGFALAGNSGLVASPAGTAVAFTVTTGNTGQHSVGRERLYVLRTGARRAALLYSHRLRFELCERWTDLSWHGDWLLFAAPEGTTLALDTARPSRRVDLTAVAARVGGRGARVRWG